MYVTPVEQMLKRTSAEVQTLIDLKTQLVKSVQIVKLPS